MPGWLKLAAAGGILLLAATFLIVGQYTAISVGQGRVLILNRLTGRAWVCQPSLEYKCLGAGEAPPKAALDYSGLKPLAP